MTRTEALHQELEEMGVKTIDCPGLSRKALAFADGYLALGKLESEKEALAVLTHEKWHYKLGAFYRADAPYAQKQQVEARVDRRALDELVPKARLTQLLRQGLRVYEIAEVLEVPETVVWEAWRYYKDTDARLWAEENE